MGFFFKIPFATGGDKTAIPATDPGTGVVNYTQGFGIKYQTDPATTGLNIPRDQFNELMYEMTNLLNQYQIRGFPEFITTADNGGTPYSYGISATVRFAGGHGGAAAMNYYSLVDANTATPADATKWGLVQYSSSRDLVGTVREYVGATLPTGYVWANGATIGNAASGATGRANSDTAALFTLLWDSYGQAVLPIQTSAGGASSRGASAAADYAANKRLPVPDKRGRVSAGKDDMGGAAAAGRITTGGAGISGATLGASGGDQTVSLTSNQNGPHSHSGTGAAANEHAHLNGVNFGSLINPGAINGPMVYGWTPDGAPGLADNPDPGPFFGRTYTVGDEFLSNNNYNFQGYTSTVAAHTHTLSIGSSGLGSAHQNAQPTIIANFIIALGTV